MTRMIARPKGWIKANRVRVVRNKGKLVVEVDRTKPKRKKKSNPSRKRKPKARPKPKPRKSKKRATPRKKGKR